MTVTILKGDCREVLGTLPAESVHCVVTSPPYFGLRDYGVAGQIGLERTPSDFVTELVAVFRGLRRVLKPDGTCWLNLGDSYAGGGGHSPNAPSSATSKSGKYGALGALKSGGLRPGNPDKNGGVSNRDGLQSVPGLKAKDLVGIPWRVAFALQADGWYLRQDIIWSKPNPMPESVRDRCTKAHEYIFMLSKSARYHYDADAISEPQKEISVNRLDRANTGTHAPGQTAHGGVAGPRVRQSDKQRGHSRRHAGFNDRWDAMERQEQLGNANKRSVWNVATQGYSEAHFATFPPALIEPCILAGCPEFTCSECGTVLDKSIKDAIRSSTNGHALRSLSSDLSEATIAPDAEQVLQPQVHGSSADDSASDSELRMVREACNAGPQGQAAQVLQQGVRVPLDGQEPQHQQGTLHHVEGLRGDLHAGPSERDQGRLCDGASAGDGSKDRSATVAERDRASSKRHSAREPREQSGSASQVRARQDAKGENGKSVLPALQRHDNAVPTCPHCKANLARVGAIVPGTVLDPFGGAGTTGLVADRLGRNAILIELNPEYAAMAERRIKNDAGMFAEVS